MSIDIDKALADAGMITITEALAGGPMDIFFSHTGVVDLDSLMSWVVQQRRETLSMIARHDLGIHKMDTEIYEFLLGRNYQATTIHMNLRNVLERMKRD